MRTEIATIKEEVRTRLIDQPRSLVLACDVDSLDRLSILCDAVEQTPGVSAVKIGFTLVCRFGMQAVVDVIRHRTSAKIIYDHQKGGTDIPDLATEFARVTDPVDAVILFPMSGPHSQRAFTQALQERRKPVLIGAAMTHKGFLASQGGYIDDSALDRIFIQAVESGVRDFVFPGTDPAMIRRLRATVEKQVSAGDYDIFAPGLIVQGGSIDGLRESAGPRWHAIIGRAVASAAQPIDVLADLARTLYL